MLLLRWDLSLLEKWISLDFFFRILDRWRNKLSIFPIQIQSETDLWKRKEEPTFILRSWSPDRSTKMYFTPQI